MGTELGALIAKQRSRYKMTLEAIAAQLGVSYPAVQQWEKGKTSPSRDKIEKLAEALKVDPSIISKILDKEANRRELLRPTSSEEAARVAEKNKKYEELRLESIDKNIDFYKLVDDHEAEESVRFLEDTRKHTFGHEKFVNIITDDSVPVLGISVEEKANGSDFRFVGQTFEYIARPPGLKFSKTAYAIYIVSDAMFPKFEPNEIVFVNPDRVPVANDYVIINLKDDTSSNVVSSFVRKLDRRENGRIFVSQFNPSMSQEFSLEQVEAIHRIVPTRELLGL